MAAKVSTDQLWKFLSDRERVHYYRLVTSPSSEGKRIGELQVQATQLANMELVQRYGLTATELLWLSQ